LETDVTEKEIEQRKLRTPNRNELEMYGKITLLTGVKNLKVMCEDGVERVCRLPGKMFKHIWVKPNDIVIVKLWDFQPSKGDIVWRYVGYQINELEKRGELDKLYQHTGDVKGTHKMDTIFQEHTKHK
jgi:translation initiation factor 1A